MGDILRELVGYNSHNILGVTKCDPRSHTDRWDKWMLLVSSDGKDWDKDPRPPNWTKMGWTLSVKRPGSPLLNVNDSKKYVTLRWDSEGHSVSKETVRLNHNISSQDGNTVDGAVRSPVPAESPLDVNGDGGFMQAKSRRGNRNNLHGQSSGPSIPKGRGHIPLATGAVKPIQKRKKNPPITVLNRSLPVPSPPPTGPYPSASTINLGILSPSLVS